MLRTSSTSQALKIALAKGMYVTKEGVLIGSRGKPSNATKPCSNGYLMFSVYDHNGKLYRGLVHQLQAFLKYGDAIFTEKINDIHIRHLNGNPLDNSWENIALGSQSDNCMDIPEDKRIKAASIASKAATIITRGFHAEDVRRIRKAKEQGASLSELSKEFGKSKGHLSDIINRKIYKDIGD